MSSPIISTLLERSGVTGAIAADLCAMVVASRAPAATKRVSCPECSFNYEGHVMGTRRGEGAVELARFAVHGGDRLRHELEFRWKIALGRLQQDVQVIEETQEAKRNE